MMPPAMPTQGSVGAAERARRPHEHAPSHEMHDTSHGIIHEQLIRLRLGRWREEGRAGGCGDLELGRALVVGHAIRRHPEFFFSFFLLFSEALLQPAFLRYLFLGLFGYYVLYVLYYIKY